MEQRPHDLERRGFLKFGLLSGLGLALPGAARATDGATQRSQPPPARAPGDAPRRRAPVIISTWNHGLPANRRAWEILASGGSVLDAVEQGVQVSEADPAVTSVGLGGRPNRDGVVELDAAIQDGTTLRAGGVAALQGVLHPISVARRVMERTPHVLLVGAGALEFARSEGFPEQDLLTPQARAAWEAERARQAREPAESPTPGTPDATSRPTSPRAAGPDDHDTIGLVALDATGSMAAACTTSGMAWKLPGRVGDSPIIGAGLYCDAQAGGAAATGVGEEVLRVCGSYQVVEFLRQGIEPQEAVQRVLLRLLARHVGGNVPMVGFVALRADGAVGFASTTPGFQAALSQDGRHELLDAPVVSRGG